MSYDVQVKLVRDTFNEATVPGFFLFDVTVSLDGRTMSTKIVHETLNPTDEEVLLMLGNEAGLADVYNTPILFQRVFDALYMEPEMLVNTFEDMQNNAKQFKYVLGPVLYDFYVNQPFNEDSVSH